MRDVKIEKCPFCGGEEFVETRVMSYGGVYVSRKAPHEAALYATICRDCGSVVRTHCDAHKLFSKKERIDR